MKEMIHFYFLSMIQTLWHCPSAPSRTSFLRFINVLCFFVSRTLPSWSCDKTTCTQIRTTGKTHFLPYDSFHYCSPLDFNLPALSELCLTVRFTHYRPPISSLKNALSIVHHQPHVPQSFAIPTQRLKKAFFCVYQELIWNGSLVAKRIPPSRVTLNFLRHLHASANFFVAQM